MDECGHGVDRDSQLCITKECAGDQDGLSWGSISFKPLAEKAPCSTPLHKMVCVCVINVNCNANSSPGLHLEIEGGGGGLSGTFQNRGGRRLGGTLAVVPP